MAAFQWSCARYYTTQLYRSNVSDAPKWNSRERENAATCEKLKPTRLSRQGSSLAQNDSHLALTPVGVGWPFLTGSHVHQTKVTYKQMALLTYGGMCAHLAKLIGAHKFSPECSLAHCPSSAHWLLQSLRFSLDFPMPCYLFSSLNLFILSGPLSAASVVWASC